MPPDLPSPARAPDALSPPHDARARFIRAHTVRCAVPLVPELSLFTATEVTPLWTATEAWLRQHDLPPPFWAFPWAGGQALARHVLDHPALVRGKAVLDFACGGGLVALAAVRAGAAHVTALDVDPFAASACALNAEAHALPLSIVTADRVGETLPGVDVLLAGDIFYEAAAAQRFLPWLRRLAAEGVVVLVGDPSRTYTPGQGFRRLASHDVPTHPDLEGAPRKLSHVLEILP